MAYDHDGISDEDDENLELIDLDSYFDPSESKKERGRNSKPKFEEPYTVYNFSDIVTFISLVEEREEIWNSQNKDWHRREVRMKKFAEIEKLCQRFMSHNARKLGKCAEERWKEIAKDYGIYVQRINKAKSGSGTMDVQSNFKYASYLNFLLVAKQKRDTKVAYEVGCKEDAIIETPKRARKEAASVAPKAPKASRIDDIEDTMKEEMAKTRDVFVKIMGNDTPATSSTNCQSDRICSLYADLVDGKSRIDKYKIESKILALMNELSVSPGSQVPRQSQVQRQSQSRDSFSPYHSPMLSDAGLDNYEAYLQQ